MRRGGVRAPLRMRAGAEFERIGIFLRAVDAPPPTEATLPPGDDAVPIRAAAGESIVITTDLSVEDVHFRRAWLTWEAIGYRATASALSDLAAMAARPLGVLISLGLPPELDDRVLEELAGGVGECLHRAGAGLLGGDLSRSPGAATIDVVAVGAAADPIGRATAEDGDELWVTGSLGGAAAAAAAWDSGLEPDPRARRSFERPIPRTAEALWLSERVRISAAIDLSDGLVGDAGHIAAASGAQLRIEEALVPMHPVLEEYSDRTAALRLAVAGGEDYELLVAVREGRLADVEDDFERMFALRLTRIGRVCRGEGVVLVGLGGEELRLGLTGFDHFAG